MNLCIAFITLVFSFFAASADAAPAPVKKEPQSSKFGPFEPPPERNFPYGDGDKPYTINTVQSEDVKKDTAASEGTKDVEKKYPDVTYSEFRQRLMDLETNGISGGHLNDWNRKVLTMADNAGNPKTSQEMLNRWGQTLNSLENKINKKEKEKKRKRIEGEGGEGEGERKKQG